MTKTIYEMTYGELKGYSEKVIEQLRLRAYGEGYKQGKFDQRVESAIENGKRVLKEEAEKVFKTAKEEIDKRNQKERDEIVARAKMDIEGLKDAEGSLTGRRGYRAPYAICDAEFIVNKKKRTIVCLLKGQVGSNALYGKGIAKCAPGDCFNVHIGKAIALRRALGLEVPDGYLNAPQPTEVQVGDVIRMKSYNPYNERPDHYYEKIINSFDGDKVRYEGGGFDFRRDVDKDAKIIDDSRDGKEGGE